MEQQPKILLVENDQEQSDAFSDVSKGIFDLEVADNIESAIGRVGVQHYRLIVLDPKIDDGVLIRRLIAFFKEAKVPVMIFGERFPGANGYPVLSRKDRGMFISKVSGLLDRVAAPV